MSLILNKPKEPKERTENEFVAAANERPGKKKSDMINFRAPPAFHEIIANEAARTGQNQTTILKAALIAYERMDDNDKNYWLLESAKAG
ncbi:CopG family transcriptional regulator [Salmonella enterica]|nr:CopG family transcriptional regulator [Salmonella enterica]